MKLAVWILTAVNFFDCIEIWRQPCGVVGRESRDIEQSMLAAATPGSTGANDAMFAGNNVVPVVTLQNARDAVPLARALLRGGIGVLEITLRTSAGLDAIKRVATEVPDIWVGAGTILTVREFGAALEVGAKFAVSPGATRNLLAAGQNAPIALLPGALSPTEVMTALEWGYTTLKFFPAEPAGGIATLAALSGPFPAVKFCASGGITLGTAPYYLRQSNVAAVACNWMTPKSAIDDHDWTRVEALARQTVVALQPFAREDT
jgi:2-dehydro-3-deoxyphosphogluconate aldolase/(4S)-4-hydroxy-2-oxoglutarate aldolase